ncbi:unnamed protein product [Cyprideis torosa]|uniref:Uncharacterized protein n=1 Tax=Cyprideis torosa TaxID=163714 RepID=A0A7R8ZS90_9CRUS|nr:unnamed protein product [Cyprideis torosa]CAG0894955.1 unnamed protein product [Cyprideis torosa]
MNPLTNVKNIKKLSETELNLGLSGKASWHSKYKDSAWIFIGGLPYDLTEGDVICVFSQYGEVVNINLIRDKKTGRSKGYGFLCYEDQRSTILAVDNLNGIKLLSRVIRVDHVEDYKPPEEKEDMDEERVRLFREGCAPEVVTAKDREEAERRKRREADAEKIRIKQESEEAERRARAAKEEKRKQKAERKRLRALKRKEKKKRKEEKKKKTMKKKKAESSTESSSDSDSSDDDRKKKSKQKRKTSSDDSNSSESEKDTQKKRRRHQSESPSERKRRR